VKSALGATVLAAVNLIIDSHSLVMPTAHYDPVCVFVAHDSKMYVVSMTERREGW